MRALCEANVNGGYSFFKSSISSLSSFISSKKHVIDYFLKKQLFFKFQFEGLYVIESHDEYIKLRVARPPHDDINDGMVRINVEDRKGKGINRIQLISRKGSRPTALHILEALT